MANIQKKKLNKKVTEVTHSIQPLKLTA